MNSHPYQPATRKEHEYANAELALKAALDLYPNYHYVFANLAEIRKEQRNYAAAAELYKKRHESAPHPEESL